MKELKYILILILALFTGSVFSQNSAEDIFHLSGKLYINGNSKAAKMEVNRGLHLFPNDPKLNSLADKIKEEEKQKQQQQQQQQDKQQNKEKDEQSQENEKQNTDSQEQQSGGEKQEKENEKQKSQQPQEGITKEDAERILNVIEQQEKELLEDMEKRKSKSRKEPADKEW